MSGHSGAHRGRRKPRDNGRAGRAGSPAAAPPLAGEAAGPDGQPGHRMPPAGLPARPAPAGPAPGREHGGPVFGEDVARRYAELRGLVDQLRPAAAHNGAGLADRLRAVAPDVNDGQLSWLVLVWLGYALDVRDTYARDFAGLPQSMTLTTLLETTAAAAAELGVFDYWPGADAILSGDAPNPA